MPRQNAMWAVELRQRRELEQQRYDRARAEDSRLRLTANWENRGAGVVSQQDIMRHLDRVQAEHNDALVARRRRLAELLSRERETHESMLQRLAETDAQRRERLIQKARDLRAQQAAELRLETQRRHDRLFREKIDSLRLAESRLKVMQVADARFDQLDLAAQRKAEAAREASYFAQQREEAARLQSERAQRDHDEAFALQQRTRDALDAQIDGNRRRDAQLQEAAEKEKDEVRAQWARDAADAEAARAERRRRHAQLTEEMRDFNTQLELARRQDYERLRREDRDALDQILAEVAADAQRETEERRKRRESAAAHMAQVRAQAGKKNDDAAQLDRLWDEANAREWAKREEKWNADQKRRDDILRSVLIARREQVLDRRQRQKDDAARAKQEHEEFLRVIANTRDIDAEERARRYALLKDTQKYLEGQIRRREDERDAERIAKEKEQSEQQALEVQYAERIRREMENLERAKPERYKDVPLLPRQRHRPF